MAGVLKNYASTLTLLGAVILGAVAVVLLPDKVGVVKPVGDIFFNLVYVLIVPLVFFSICSSVCKLSSSKDAGRVFAAGACVFVGMAAIAGVIAYIAGLILPPVQGSNAAALLSETTQAQGNAMSGADALTATVTVPDFPLLFSKEHLLPMMIIAALIGFATAAAGEKGSAFAGFLESGSQVTMKAMQYVLFLAPLGLGCYFACTVAAIGSSLLEGYLRVFVMYWALTLVFFFVANPLYMLLAQGKKGPSNYWKHICPPSLTALSSSSGAVAMPGNILAAQRMGVPGEIAESIIPLGTNIHKDGSMIAAVMKAMFLLLLMGQPVFGPEPACKILLVGLLAAIVIGAIPGGGMTGELLTCTLLGFDPSLAGILVLISTLVDMPATLLNSSSNVVAAALTARFTSRPKN